MHWAFQAREETRVIAVASMVRQCILATGVFLFVRTLADAIALPLADAIGVGVVAIGEIIILSKRQGRPDFEDAWRGARALARTGFPVALSALAWSLRLYAPLLMLGKFREGTGEPGIFGAAHRLVISAHTFVWLYFANLLPAATRAATTGDHDGWKRLIKRSLNFVAWTVCGGAVIGTVLAPFVVTTINGRDFAASGAPLAMMLWMLVLAFLSGHYRYSLVAFGHVREEFFANFCGAIFAIAACAAFGVRLNAVLAASIFVGAEAITLGIAMLLLRRRVGTAPWPAMVFAPLGIAAAFAAYWVSRTN